MIEMILSHLHISLLEEVARLISFNGGEAGASSQHASDHGPDNAFQLGIWSGDYYPWANLGAADFPHTVWYRFPKPVEVGKFSFSSRDDHMVEQSPRKFDFVGSDDCETWTAIQSYETEFTKLSETKEWTIPAGSRISFRCYGVRVAESGDTTHVAIKHMQMWSFALE